MKLNQCAFLAMSLLASLHAAPVQVGLGSYSSELPAGMIAPTNSSGAALSPAITNTFTGPIPTNDWASSLVFQRNPQRPHPLPMFAHPWVVQADSSGLRLGAPAGTGVSDAAIVVGTSWDIAIGVPGQSNAATKLHAQSDWTVTASLYANSIQATFGHGLPFVYLQRQGTIEIKLAAAPSVQSNAQGVVQFSIGDRRYAAYAASSTVWTVNGNTISADLGGAGYMSVALLPDQSEATAQLFRDHAFAFVTDTKVQWAYDSTKAISQATYSFTVQSKRDAQTQTLFALYPHQARTLAGNQSIATGHTYRSARGDMVLRKGTSFVTRTPMPPLFPIIPFAAPLDSRYSPTEMRNLLQSWASRTDAQLVRRNADTYWTGKDLGRLAILVNLAEAAGHNDLKERFLTLLRTRLEGWLTYTPGETNECFAYQSTWKTLIGLSASYGSGDELNDHHFHYGYFIIAAATVARMVPGWGDDSKWGGMVKLVAKEAANANRNDSFSPFLRTFDIYAGHSWASGHANFGDGNNQESSSESLNFSAGLVLWGMATGDTATRNLGTYLFATEVQAVREYWFDVYNENFPLTWTKNAAGMVWGGKVDYATWFSGEPEMIHGINWLPLTGASLFMGFDVEYAEDNYDLLIEQNKGPANQWVDVVWAYRAFSDVDDAWQLWQNNPGYTPEDGESQPHTYAHILSLGALGQIDTAIRGDIPTAAVFRNGTTTRYTAYNPTAAARLVRFSNGRGLQVAAGAWAISETTIPVGLATPIQRPSGLRLLRQYDLLGRYNTQK